jgi:hypothetical protein
VTLKDASEWILIKCDPIVEVEIWKRAQEKIKKANILYGK